MVDEERRRNITKVIRSTMTQNSVRDLQKSVGPSEIGDPCGRCLGRALCRKYPELWWEEQDLRDTRFSLKAWVGTAVHEKMDRDMPSYTEELGQHSKEIKIPIWDLPGYGLITGHTDMFVDRTVVDYKTKDDRTKIREIALDGPKTSEVVQINLYGFGLMESGHAVEDLCLFYIPRDSNRIEDTLGLFTQPLPVIAERALQRLRKVWRIVQDGQGASLKSHEDCYNCNIRYYLK